MTLEKLKEMRKNTGVFCFLPLGLPTFQRKMKLNKPRHTKESISPLFWGYYLQNRSTTRIHQFRGIMSRTADHYSRRIVLDHGRPSISGPIRSIKMYSCIQIFFFSLYVFGEPVVHFRNFFLCCPSQRSARSQVPSLGGNPPGDWQSAVVFKYAM